MPKLSQAFDTKVVSLPSFPDAEIVVKNNISVNDISVSEKQEDDISKSLAVAVKLIVSWNFTTEHDEPLPISIDILKEFPIEDVKYLIESVVLPIAQKKTDSEKTSS